MSGWIVAGLVTGAVIVAAAFGDILYGACQAMYFRQPGNHKVFRRYPGGKK